MENCGHLTFLFLDKFGSIWLKFGSIYLVKQGKSHAERRDLQIGGFGFTFCEILRKIHISDLYFDDFSSGLATCLFFHHTFHSGFEPYVSSHRTFHSGLDQMSGLVVRPSRTFLEVAHMAIFDHT